MNEAERREFIEIFNEGFEAIVLPHLEEIYKKLEEHDRRFEKIEYRLDDIESHLGRMDRKLDGVIEHQDDHSVRIKNLEDKAFHQN